MEMEFFESQLLNVNTSLSLLEEIINIDVALRTIINLLVEKGIISKQEFLEKSKHIESNDTYKHFYENKDAMLKQSELLQTVISKLKQDS
ncbi:hypothetical protein D3Z52_08260 [Clostridiaceae bacterium]|nr:hypothetical protein [Clostridiaceae bacterium]